MEMKKMLLKETVDSLKEKRRQKEVFMLSLRNRDVESIEVVVVENGKEKRETISLDAAKIALLYDLTSVQNVILHNNEVV